MRDPVSAADFDRIARLARARWGLHLTEKKVGVVSNRMIGHLRRAGFDHASDYLDHLERSGSDADWLDFFDLLSTNTTSFYRDPAHFAFLEREFYTPLARGRLTTPNKRLRLWSAACSTGCEPYTLAMNAIESLPDLARWDLKILATDLANSALQAAREGVYKQSQIEHLSPERRRRFFQPVPGGAEPRVRVTDEVRGLVALRRLNLMDAWPMRGPFQVIMCRNVMIYFDRETRERLVQRFCRLLAPGGYLIVGSAETLSGLRAPLASVSPNIYRFEAHAARGAPT